MTKLQFKIVNHICEFICYILTCLYFVNQNIVDPYNNLIKTMFIFLLIFFFWRIIGGIIYGIQCGIWENEEKTERSKK